MNEYLQFRDRIPEASVFKLAPGDMLPVLVSAVYSPNHLRLQRLGPQHELMKQLMALMTEYYSNGAGMDRVLPTEARRPGQYCSSVFEGVWHRSLILDIEDSDTVKVWHLDTGTASTVLASTLRSLRREWAWLPAQAVRACLAGQQPAAEMTPWPRATASYCVDLIRERQLVAQVDAVNYKDLTLEVYLIDTSAAKNVNITDLMSRAAIGVSAPEPDFRKVPCTSKNWSSCRCTRCSKCREILFSNLGESES